MRNSGNGARNPHFNTLLGLLLHTEDHKAKQILMSQNIAQNPKSSPPVNMGRKKIIMAILSLQEPKEIQASLDSLIYRLGKAKC